MEPHGSYYAEASSSAGWGREEADDIHRHTHSCQRQERWFGPLPLSLATSLVGADRFSPSEDSGDNAPPGPCAPLLSAMVTQAMSPAPQRSGHGFGPSPSVQGRSHFADQETEAGPCVSHPGSHCCWAAGRTGSLGSGRSPRPVPPSSTAHPAPGLRLKVKGVLGIPGQEPSVPITLVGTPPEASVFGTPCFLGPRMVTAILGAGVWGSPKWGGGSLSSRM